MHQKIDAGDTSLFFIADFGGPCSCRVNVYVTREVLVLIITNFIIKIKRDQHTASNTKSHTWLSPSECPHVHSKGPRDYG